MKKIVYLSTSLALGGAETQLTRMVILLKARGWDIKIISMTPPLAYVDELKAKGIFVETLNMARGKLDVVAFFRFIRIMKLEKPDILNTFMVHASLLGRFARLFVRVPVLVSSARSVFEGGGIRSWWYRTTDFLCDMTTQVSRVGLRRYVDEKLVPKDKIVYIFNGVDPEKFRKDADARSRFRRDLDVENSFVWLAVGRLEEDKDYSNMIRAFSLIPRKAGCSLLIVGEGSLYQKVERQVKELGLDKVIRFLGVQKDLSCLMSASDAFVLSSSLEGMANVLLEATSCELPVVATAVGENSALVLDGVTGFVVPCKNSEKLAEAMGRLMDLPLEDRLRMGKEGRRHIEKEYSLERAVDAWEKLYIQLLAKT